MDFFTNKNGFFAVSLVSFASSVVDSQSKQVNLDFYFYFLSFMRLTNQKGFYKEKKKLSEAYFKNGSWISALSETQKSKCAKLLLS